MDQQTDLEVSSAMLPMLPKPGLPGRPPFRMDFPARSLVLIVVVIAVTAMVQSGSGVVAACGVAVAAALTAEAICDRLEAREGPRS